MRAVLAGDGAGLRRRQLGARRRARARSSPRLPTRSVFNSVFYEDGEKLLASLDELAEAYEEAGIEAWTVWVPRSDEEVAQGLEAAGHKLDAKPRGDGDGTPTSSEPEPDPGLEIREEYDMAELARINEIAYGYPPGDFVAVADGRPEGLRVYFGDLDGEAVGDAGHLGPRAATARRLGRDAARGARPRDLRRPLGARARGGARAGIETTTLQATKLGYPVYAGLGYRDVRRAAACGSGDKLGYVPCPRALSDEQVEAAIDALSDPRGLRRRRARRRAGGAAAPARPRRGPGRGRLVRRVARGARC